MKLTSLLRLQLLYAALGLGFNLLSYVLIASGRPGLTPVNPVVGSATLLIYVLMLLPGFYRKLTPYRILMGVCVIALGYGGVVGHVLNAFDKLSLYASPVAWALAVLINGFGLVLNLIAVAGWFKTETRQGGKDGQAAGPHINSMEN